MDGWLGSRPDYRPDRLGVMFSESGGALTIWEVTPGALADPRVDHIKNRLKNRYKAPGLGVRRYPLTVLDDLIPATEMLSRCKNGVLAPAEQTHHWQPLVRLCYFSMGRKSVMRSRSFRSPRACSRSQSQMRRCTSGRGRRLRSARGGKRPALAPAPANS